MLFIAPAAHHRVGFREGEKDYVVCKGNREAIAGSIALGLAFTAALHLVTDLVFDAVVAAIASGALFALIVWRWWALALYRNRLRNQPSGPMSAGATRAVELDDREIQAHGAHFRRAWPGRPDPAGPGDSGA